MLTYSFANQILNHMCGKVSTINLGTTIYAGLSFTAPNQDGTGYIEPGVETGYERLVLGANGQALSQLMGMAVDAEIVNTKNLFFNRALVAYPSNVTHFLIFSGTGLIAYGELTTPITVGINTVPLIEIGDLKITIDKPVE